MLVMGGNGRFGWDFGSEEFACMALRLEFLGVFWTWNLGLAIWGVLPDQELGIER